MEAMVEKFQCPGCVCGSGPDCGAFKWDHDRHRCIGHVLGTMIGLGNTIALGLPKGFCKPGYDFDKDPPRAKNRIEVRLWKKGTTPAWDRLNVPVWAMEEDGHLFVRTFAPRINLSWVDVVEDGRLEMVPGAINVAEFIDEID